MAIQQRLPTGDGSLSQWDPISNDWQKVDDPIGSPDDDATYISTSVNGNDDLFTFTAFSIDAEDDIVDGVSVTFRSRIGTGGGPGNEDIRPSIKVNGTIYYGSGVSQSSSWLTSTFTWDTNPDTGLPWNDADVNGIGANPLQEFGVEYQLGSVSEMRCTQCYIEASFVPSFINVNSEHIIPIEWLATLKPEYAIPYEWHLNISYLHIIPVEWANVSSVISPHVISLAWKSQLVTDDLDNTKQLSLEWFSNVQFNYSIAVIWNLLVPSSFIIAADWLAAVNSPNVTPIEWHGFAGIAASNEIPVEWKNNVTVNQILNPEWVTIIQVSSHILSLVWGFNILIQPDAIINLEWGGVDRSFFAQPGYKRWIDTTTGGGQTVYGVSGKFKVNPSTFSFRRRRGTNVLHLVTAKPIMIELFRPFTSEIPGMVVEPGEFNYISPSRMLRLTNMEEVSGITVDETGGDDFAIPITYIEKSDKFVITNIHQAPDFTL